MGLGHIASPVEALVGVDGTDAVSTAFGEGSLGTPVTFWILARAFSKCSFNSFIRSCETSRKAIYGLAQNAFIDTNLKPKIQNKFRIVDILWKRNSLDPFFLLRAQQETCIKW